MRPIYVSAALAASAVLTSTLSAQVTDWGPSSSTLSYEEPLVQAVWEDSASQGRSKQWQRVAATSTSNEKSPASGEAGASLISGLAESFAAQTGPGASEVRANVSGSYTPSSAVRRKLADIMGDAAAKQDAAVGEEMRKLVLSGEAVSRFQKMAPSMGLRANDAIDAFAFYMLAQWGVANDYRDMFTPAQVAGVRRQAANAYAGVSDQLSTDALRQEFGEMLVIQGMAMSGVHETAVQKGDEATASRAADLARKGGVKIFTMDPTTIELTDSGFRTKR